MSRANYRAEFLHTLGWGVFAGMVEGNTSSIVVAKTFHADDFLVAVVWATPMLANVLSLLWGAVLRGRRRMPLFVALASAAMLSVMSIGLTPARAGDWAGWLFAAQIGLARIFVAAIVNVRSSLWAMNYPGESRGRITGRLQSLRFSMALPTATGVSLLFDANPDHYRWMYPLFSLVGLLSLLPLRRMRVRGERSELRRLAQRRAANGDAAATGVVANLRESARILREDRPFARYCTAQHMLGSANFMVDPVLNVVIASTLKFNYLSSILLLDIIRNLVLLFSVPAWSRHFDRVGVLHFRVRNTLFWMGSTGLAAMTLLLISRGGTAGTAAVAVLVVSRVLNGIGRGGGAIAWNLGHLHFADAHNADLYMGIHVALTGIRGLLMPFIAVLLNAWFGWWSLVVATLFNLAAVVMFMRLAGEKSQLGSGTRSGAVPDALARDS